MSLLAYKPITIDGNVHRVLQDGACYDCGERHTTGWNAMPDSAPLAPKPSDLDRLVRAVEDGFALVAGAILAKREAWTGGDDELATWVHDLRAAIQKENK